LPGSFRNSKKAGNGNRLDLYRKGLEGSRLQNEKRLDMHGIQKKTPLSGRFTEVMTSDKAENFKNREPLKADDSRAPKD
jgi:hypothetical protein